MNCYFGITYLLSSSMDLIAKLADFDNYDNCFIHCHFTYLSSLRISNYFVSKVYINHHHSHTNKIEMLTGNEGGK